MKSPQGWKRPFDDPIPLPRGRQLVTLKDAANFIQKLPKAEQDLEEWQAAVEVLLLVELNGPTMMAHRCHEGIEPRPRSEAKARYLMTDPKKDACKPTHNKLGRSKQSLEARQRVVEEY